MLRWLFSIGLLGFSIKALFFTRPTFDPGGPSLRPLMHILRHPQSAAIVGGEYLRLRPGEADVSILGRLLELPLVNLSNVDAARRTLSNEFVARHRKDFRTGQVLKINGWTLSVTELRLCALVHLDLKKA